MVAAPASGGLGGLLFQANVVILLGHERQDRNRPKYQAIGPPSDLGWRCRVDPILHTQGLGQPARGDVFPAVPPDGRHSRCYSVPLAPAETFGGAFVANRSHAAPIVSNTTVSPKSSRDPLDAGFGARSAIERPTMTGGFFAVFRLTGTRG